MKLPWDKNYLKISFHVIFTLLIVSILGIAFFNIIPIINSILKIIGIIFSVLAPLWIGLIIAYLLDPIADYFQIKSKLFFDKHHLKFDNWKSKLGLNKKHSIESIYQNRAAGAAISYIMVLICIILLGIFISFSFGNSGGSSNVEGMINQFSEMLDGFTKFLNNILFKISELGVSDQVNQIFKEIISKLTSFSTNLGNQLVAGISKTGGFIVNLAIGIVISFYFIKDKNMILFKLNEFLNLFIPRNINLKLRTILSDIDAVFSGYIRGQLTDAAIMALLITISLSIIGIDFSVLIGIISGFSNIIPYIGAFIGLALAVIVGLLNGTPLKALAALIVILILQQVDGAIISPKVVGNQIDLHPILVILALSVGGTLFGLWGMILAVPITAILKIFLNRYIKRRKSNV